MVVSDRPSCSQSKNPTSISDWTLSPFRGLFSCINQIELIAGSAHQSKFFTNRVRCGESIASILGIEPLDFMSIEEVASLTSQRRHSLLMLERTFELTMLRTTAKKGLELPQNKV